ncbi:hypothetical protein [Streptomyces luteogriseus]|uniref:Uncharacterized protein n=1 Tax=Streptomyces luteogriseus TaxID=68233 RepID=A0A7W7DRU1_9ACTN|nr:hypothetical protein [Streptomyces luteogriseus]MBB4714855.1 hypothetical protein [Streptomyces luteogriseus]
MKEWREDAQPEWPEAATATGELLSDDRARDRRATQVFPGREVRATGHGLTAGTEILRGIPRQSDGEADSRTPEPASRTAVRDPWQEPEEAAPSGHTPEADGQTHDPHEVTVQLDAVQLGEGFLRQVKEGPGAEAAADRPVFVDESGRRSRRYRRIGMAIALACGVYAVVIVATLLSGNSNAPWLPVPTREDNPPAGQVDSPPLTAESEPGGEAGDTGVTAPGSAPATGEATAPAPGPSAVAPGATAGPGRAGTSAKPSPTATRTTPAPDGKATPPAPTRPADPPSTPAADPTPTVEPTAPPTETTGTDGDGGTVAEGPAESQPVAEGPAEPQPVAETPTAA